MKMYLPIYLFITYNRNSQCNFDHIIADVTPFAIVIVISKLLKRQSKAKRREPAYSLAMWQIKRVVNKVVQDKLRSDFQRARGEKVLYYVVLCLII